VLRNRLSSGVSAKDLILSIIGQVGADGANYCSVEVHGDISGLTIEDRLTVANMAIEMGAKNLAFPADSVATGYLASVGVPPGVHAATWADPDAAYERVLEFDLAALAPVVAFPHKVDNVKPVTEAEGIEIDQCLLGTCTNGRLSDFAVAAGILKGRQISPGVRLLLLPASRGILQEAMIRGYIPSLIQAGGTLLPPGCGPCLGAHQGILAPGEKCISTSNRNFKGRMGCKEAEIYLAGPATVAASALHGRISDPRKELR
jgi:homoaconitase/3-isopropylmalate dehydratase large subunit